MSNVEQLPAKQELRAGAPVQAIVPQTMEDAYRIATAVVKAGMAPKDMNTQDKCLIAIMQGMEVGMTPMQSLQRIAVINGRTTIWGDAAIGLVRASGLCEYIKEEIEGSGDGMIAHCGVKRKGESEPVSGSFSVEDAKSAGLWGRSGPWKQYPKRMLQMRARGFVLRDVFADVLGGMYLQEEMEGARDMVDVTPPLSPPPAPSPETPEPEPQAMPDIPEQFDRRDAVDAEPVDPDAYLSDLEEKLAGAVQAADRASFDEIWEDHLREVKTGDVFPADIEAASQIYTRLVKGLSG